ncbi:MAG: DUF1990 family protein [Bacteroidetes bacterium]|nr:DUF1990 family protein [Bacteroidota bacterium]HET6243844.1 DUF1990 family protein [Bacteroidia bacterium]
MSFRYQKDFIKHKISKELIDCKFSDLSFSSFFDYKIFPANILIAYPQWIEEKRTMQAGDTIVQQINIPPFSKLSKRLIVAVRIKEVFDSSNCKGFSYETIVGHVEKGISIFKIESQKNFSVFTIETYSSPASSLLKFFRPISSWYQDYCTKKALVNVRDYLLIDFFALTQ